MQNSATQPLAANAGGNLESRGSSMIQRAPTKKEAARETEKVCAGVERDVKTQVTYYCGNTCGEWIQCILVLLCLWFFVAMWFWACISVYFEVRNIDP